MVGSYIPFDDQFMPTSLPTVHLKHALSFPQVVILVKCRASVERVQVAARNYYHWVVEGLSRLVIAKEILDKDPSIILLVPANPPRKKKSNPRRPFVFQ